MSKMDRRTYQEPMIYRSKMSNIRKLLITFAIIIAIIAYIYEVKTVVQLHQELLNKEVELNSLMDENTELRYTLFEITDNPYWIETMYATEEQEHEKTSE